MTLREVIKAHPSLFYRQTWYEDEPFMDRNVHPLALAPNRFVVGLRDVDELVDAAMLALCYVEDPANPIWQHYLWTADVDSQGQRVYVGDNGKGLEIHRHLHLTERWGTPLWVR